MRGKIRYRFFFTKKQLTFMLTGVMLAYGLVFVMGFMLGKGVVGENEPAFRKSEVSPKAEKRAKGKRSIKTKRDSEETKTKQEKDPSDSELTFFKTLVRKKTLPAKHQTAAVKTPPPLGNYGNQKRREEIKKKALRKDEQRSGPLSGYTLQVGSFQKKGRAENLVKQLRNKGYPAYIISSNIPMKGIWYRVRTGHFPTRAEAKKSALDLEMKERLPAYVTFVSE